MRAAAELAFGAYLQGRYAARAAMRAARMLPFLPCAMAACFAPQSERLVGEWNVQLNRDSLQEAWWEFTWRADTIALRPPFAAGLIELDIPDHECAQCVEGIFSIDFSPIVLQPPPNDRARASLTQDSVKVVLGLGGDMGELSMIGFFVDSSTIVGRWNQIFEADELDGGAFAMRHRVR